MSDTDKIGSSGCGAAFYIMLLLIFIMCACWALGQHEQHLKKLEARVSELEAKVAATDTEKNER